MSEIAKLFQRAAGIRARLLATACVTALFAAGADTPAAAADNNQPIVWVELGGAFTQFGAAQEDYAPPFAQRSPRLSFITVSSTEFENRPPTSWDGDAKVTFNPPGLDWSFSAGVVYGRSTRQKSIHQQTTQRSGGYIFGQYNAYQSIESKNDESHLIVDFQAGKDVGLGLFGVSSHSKINIGIRYAQFNMRGATTILYQPTNIKDNYHLYYGIEDAQRKFTGVGPSLSWDASANVIGNAEDGITVDFGVNGAVLFGRQQARGHHQTTNMSITYQPGIGHFRNPVYQNSAPIDRSKQVVVPNFGGFAGLSWRYPNAKISLGYRGDFFFGAMDGGIDTARKENVGFYGPFATISVGLGG